MIFTAALPLVRTIGADIAGGIRRLILVAAAALLAALLAAGAAGCGVAALWIHITPLVGRDGAALAAAACLLLLCVLVLAAAGVVRVRRPRRAAAPATASPDPLLAELVRLTRDNQGPLLAAALAAGLMAGRIDGGKSRAAGG